MSREFKIVFISDTHFMHEKIEIPDGDFLIHAGDFTKKGKLQEVMEFNDFLEKLPHKYKIIVAGNHDFCFQKKPEKARACLKNNIYLQDESVILEGIRFYGSPWQPWFFSYAFNLRRGKPLAEKWALIPNETDILITHGPPMHHGDQIHFRNKHVGCEDLLKRVQKVKPKYHLFGHIHESYGITSNEHTTFINGSICNYKLKPDNQPIIFNYCF